MVAPRPRQGTVRPGEGQHDTLPIRGIGHPFPLARSRLTIGNTNQRKACGAPVAMRVARRGREAVQGNGPVTRPETAPWTDFTGPAAAPVVEVIDEHRGAFGGVEPLCPVLRDARMPIAPSTDYAAQS